MNLYISASLMEKMKDVDLFNEMSFGEKMLGSLVTAIMGMGITFIVLIILMYSIKAMGAILRDKKSTATTVPETPAAAAAPAAAPAVEIEDDEEIIAVITAAIAAQEGGRGFVVKNVYRAPTATGWNAAGRTEAFESRRTTIQKRS